MIFMSNIKNIHFTVHPPMEFLYSLFALGTGKHFFDMIKGFDLEPNNEIVEYIAELDKELSRYMKQELSYFFDLSGLGYIFYKYILTNEEVTSVPELLDIFSKTSAEELAFNIVTSVCKNIMPSEDSSDYRDLKSGIKSMLVLVERASFQDEQRRFRVFDAIQNPEEFKQRLSFLLSQFYAKYSISTEAKILKLIYTEKDKYEKLYKEDSDLFLDRYLSLECLNVSTETRIHLSFFKYVSWHHYSMYDSSFSDWFILGIYSDILFNVNFEAEKLAVFFKAISDANRIEILKLLLERPWFGQELAEKLNITPATISYHMGFLQQIGAVTFKRADNRSYYSLNSSKLLKPLEDFISYFRIN